MSKGQALDELIYGQLAVLWLEASFPNLPYPGDSSDPFTIDDARFILRAIAEKTGRSDVLKDLVS